MKLSKLLIISIALMTLNSCLLNNKVDLTIPFPTKIQKVLPHKVTAKDWHIFFMQMYETLFNFNKRGELRPLLIKDWDYNKEDFSYTFTLKKGVLFHNGKELDSTDVKYSFQIALDNKSENIFSIFLNQIKEVIAVDKYVLKIILNTYTPDFLLFLGSPILKIYPNNIFKGPDDNTKMWIGTGPFKLDQFNTSFISLSKFNKYRKEVKVNNLKFLSSKNSKELFKKGELDIVHITRGELPFYQKQKDLITRSYPMLGSFFLGFDYKNKKFRNKNLRRAIFHAIDRSKIVESYKIENNLIPKSILPFGIHGYKADPKSYNITLAKKFLAKVPASELPTGEDMAIIVPHQFHSMAYYAIDIINNGLQLLGLPIITSKELKEDFGRGNIGNYYHYLRNNKFNIYIRGMITALPSSYYILKSVYSSGSAMNFGKYKNQKIENIFKNATKGPEHWNEKAIDEIISETHNEMATIPLGNLFNNIAVKKSRPLKYYSISPLYIQYKDAL